MESRPICISMNVLYVDTQSKLVIKKHCFIGVEILGNFYFLFLAI